MRIAIAFSFVALGVCLGIFLTRHIAQLPEISNNAYAAGGQIDSPTQVAPDRYVYYPVTVEL